jgi:L-lysine exporter family protein LysE/ArgO
VHLLISGILLGWGVAIPLGPINVEMIRRNILFGTRYGLAVAFGATSADTTYVLLILSGILLFLNQPIILEMVGIIGAVVLAWFAYKSLTAIPQNDTYKLAQRSWLHTWVAGYLMTLLSPFTIIFWSSISSQIASYALGKHDAVLWATLGVIIGTLSWSLSLNMVLHFTRHKVNPKIMRLLNIIGGLILLGFAIAGVVHSVKMILA